MKILFLLCAVSFSSLVVAQTDSLPNNNPAQQIASPDAGVADKTPTGQKEAYKIDAEKNAETVQEIKQRTSERKQKSIRKYKGKKSDTTKIIE